MKILSIETSCDETGIAFVEASGGIKNPKFKVLENLISSQIKIHRPFGGVVPTLAKREHLKNLPILLKQISKNPLFKKTDLIAVTVGPGLEPALWTGINFAEDIRKKYFPKTKLIGTNHLEGHLFSFLLPQKTSKSKINPPISGQKSKLLFPTIALIVSGGHTILLEMDSLTKWKKIGETRDDAAGEAFDKAARILGFLYPGGPEIQKLALGLPKNRKDKINFPRPMLNQKNYDFSFSGLKTAVLYYLKGQDSPMPVTENRKPKNAAEIAAAFQNAVTEILIKKTLRAAENYRAKSVIVCGGVAANKKLRDDMKKETKKSGLELFVPEMEFNGDNAAMIAAAGYLSLLHDKKFPLKADGEMSI